MRRAAATLLFVLTIAAVACQGGSLPGGGTSSVVPDEVGVGPRSSFIAATSVGLVGLDARGRPLGRIVSLPVGSQASGPALSLDGKTIYFALSQIRAGVGFGSEIYAVGLDGTDLRPIVARDQPNVFYASPTVGAAGELYVHRRYAKDDPGHPGVQLETVDWIERIDPQTGERHKVLDDGAEPSAVRGAAALVFVHLDRGQQAGLWTASAEGSRTAPFLQTADRFWWLQAPRVSPNGREVAWSSAGRSSAEPAPVIAARTSAGGRLAHLDIPSELYVAPIDGTVLRSIATTRDDVVPAWSPDSTKIAFIALATFYVVTASNGEVLVNSEGIGLNYGDLVWVR